MEEKSNVFEPPLSRRPKEPGMRTFTFEAYTFENTDHLDYDVFRILSLNPKLFEGFPSSEKNPSKYIQIPIGSKD